MLSIKKLEAIAINAPTPNQKNKNPTVKISIIKQIPEIINQTCHMKNIILSFNNNIAIISYLYVKINRNSEKNVDF